MKITWIEDGQDRFVAQFDEWILRVEKETMISSVSTIVVWRWFGQHLKTFISNIGFQYSQQAAMKACEEWYRKSSGGIVE